MEGKKRDAPVAYIASPLSGDVAGNIERTKEYSRFAISKGSVPLNPILNLCGVIPEETGRAEAMRIDIALLKRCADELWVFGEPSPGMQQEIMETIAIGLPIRWFTDECQEV